MRLQYSDFDAWTFTRNADGRWIWHRRSPEGEMLIESRRSFDTMGICVQDAGRHGYQGSFETTT